MQIVILAAGQSSRFEPFQQTFAHKSLITICGKTILEHTLLAVKKAGITDVILVVRKKEIFQQVLGDGSTLGLHIRYVLLPEPQGMGEALLCAKQYLDETFFLTNTNHIEIGQFIPIMLKQKKDAKKVVLLGKEEANFHTYGFMQVYEEAVTQIIEKPKKEIPNSLRIVGVYLLTSAFVKVLETIPKQHYSFEEALTICAKKGDVLHVRTKEKTYSLKYAWDLFSIKDFLLQNIEQYIAHDAQIAKNAQLIGKVHVASGAKILENAIIKGPSYIGENAFIGTNAIVRNGTCVEEDAVIGAFMEAKNTLIMERTTTHTGIIEDSLVGRECRIAAGIVTANVRLDRGSIGVVVKEEKINTELSFLGMIMGDNVQCGIRVATMPGVVIGAGSIIGPSTVVMKNIPPKTKYFTKFVQVAEEPAG